MFSGNKEIKFTDDSIQVKTPSGDKIGLASLSSGEKHLLQIFVQTLLAADNSMLIDDVSILNACRLAKNPHQLHAHSQP